MDENRIVGLSKIKENVGQAGDAPERADKFVPPCG